MTSTAPSRPISGRTRLLTAPAVAGVAYLLAWVTGLAVWPSNLDVAASGSQVVAAYTGHQGVAMTQSLLVHGVAAVALAVVVLALGQAARHRRGTSRPRHGGGRCRRSRRLAAPVRPWAAAGRLGGP